MKDLRATLDAAHKVTAHEDGDNLVLNTYQDVEPHVEYAKACRRVDAEDRGAFGKRPDLHRTMSIPFNILQAVAQKLGIPPVDIFQSEQSKRIYAELKRPEFKEFRTTIDKLI